MQELRCNLSDAIEGVCIGVQSNPKPSIKPFLRWAGSKRQQLSRLVQFWKPSHQRYIEPFAGSACLFFEIAPAQAILGDNNDSLIEVYRAVRDQPDRLFDRLCRIRRNAETYYRWRAKSPASLDAETRVVRFLFLNRNCFNGIFRTNLKGEFNVPIGTKQGAYFTRTDLRECSDQLQKTKLVAGDFTRTLKHVRAGDFVYLDPPFAVTSRRMFREYGTKSFDTTDVPRLAASLAQIDQCGAEFLVSYADCTEARTLAKRWNAVKFPIRRHVAGFFGDRRYAYEWLVSNSCLPQQLNKAR
ncbi:MAG: Dam family site-specific DNA-(adenine-N6)-methyltransferase [Planctomycetales bacterium]|nr:Dam family site-specific DNA-(adenine-N6)-methyltransferase [Planctomycetales bacterium]